SSEAPGLETYSAQLDTSRSRLDTAFAGAQAATDQALTGSQAGLDGGQSQALDALGSLYSRGADELQQLGDGFSQATRDLVTGTLSGYDATESAYEGRIDGELENSTQILQGIVTGITGLFEQINTGLAGRFSESTTQTAQGFQQSLD